jgi:hypothetical protein
MRLQPSSDITVGQQKTVIDTDPGKIFKPVRISDNGYWQNAFTQLNICHRIDANDLAF